MKMGHGRRMLRKRLVVLILALVILAVAFGWWQAGQKPLFRLIARVPISNQLGNCKAGVICQESTGVITLRGWEGQQIWQVTLPAVNLAGWRTKSYYTPFTPSGWLHAVSADGHTLAIIAADGPGHIRLSIWRGGKPIGLHRIACSDELLGICVNSAGQVVCWSRTQSPYRAWLFDGNKLAATGTLWPEADISPEGTTVLAAIPGTQDPSSHIYKHVKRATLAVENGHLLLRSPYLAKGFFTCSSPSTLIGDNTVEIVDANWCFAGVLLSFDGKRFGRQGLLPGAALAPSDTWPLSEAGAFRWSGRPQKQWQVILPGTGEKWAVASPWGGERAEPFALSDDGRFALFVCSSKKKPSPLQKLRLEYLTPTGRKQYERYLVVVEKPGIVRSRKMVSSDETGDFHYVGRRPYRLCGISIAPGGRMVVLESLSYPLEKERYLFFYRTK